MEWYERLSYRLNLIPIEQDWGIFNANGKRLDEFIDFFLEYRAEDPWEWEELADLIFQSANEEIVSGNMTEKQEARLILLVAEYKDKFPEQLNYWLKFSNKHDYPVKKLIEEGNW